MLFSRYQPPAHSPLHASALASASASVLGMHSDPRPALEARLAIRYSAQHVRLCGSGTQALQLGIEEACRRCDGADLVALPAFGCYDLATAAVGAQVRVSLYDVDPRTLGPDLESFEHVLRRGARVAVVAPFYGIPVPWEELRALAARYGVILIEDAAQGHGASLNGKPLGSLGDISVISFGRGKGWTGGAGGALLMRGTPALGRWSRNDDGHRVRAESWTLVAAVAQWLLARPRMYSLPASLPWLHLGETNYHDPVAPRSMTRAAAAIALMCENDADAEAAARRESAAALASKLPPRLEPISAPANGIAGYLRMPVRMQGAALAAIAALELRHFGVAATYPTTLAALPQIGARLAVQAQDSFDGADAVVREVFTLPTHTFVRADDHAMLLQSLRDLVLRAATEDPLIHLS